jgi:hypothetical protein
MNISKWNRQQTTIGHLKAHYSGAQEGFNMTVLRLRVERLLSNIDLHPPGLSSGAILIVRKLDNPAPVGVSTSLQPVQANWQELLRNQITALYAAAARPALGAVPLNAPSVLFVDPGEMLTCLTRDLLNGQVKEHWYWQQVLRDVLRTPGVALDALWCEQATCTPTILASLRPAELFSAITHLTPLAVKQVIHSLHESFDLPPAVLGVLASGEQEGGPRTYAVPDTKVMEKEPAARLPPWEQWLPSVLLPALSSEARYLLGLGLALHHAPAFARSSRFATRAVRWLQTEREKRSYMPDRARSLSEGSSAPGAGEQETSLPLQDNTDPQLVLLPKKEERVRAWSNDIDVGHALEQQALPSVEEQPLLAHDRDSSLAAMEDMPSRSSIVLDKRSGEEAASLSQVTRAPRQEVLLASSPQAQQPLSSSVPLQLDAQEAREFVFDAWKALPTDGVFTHLGGVLYLINLLTWLNLPHSWDDDGTFAEQMSGWAIIEALSRGLLGDLHEQYTSDPIWHILALLDEREPGTPIAVGDMPVGDKSFRLPTSCLRRYGPAVWSAFQDDEHVLLYDDAAGFLIADVPLRDRSFFEVAHAEVEMYCDHGLEVGWHLGSPEVFQKFSGSVIPPTSAERKIPAYLADDVLWWLGRALGFVRYLLARTLGESFDKPERLAELLLCRRGQLVVSRTHIDLHMSMEEINIAVRRAGLDRDPGWVSDLARIVYFHFD